MFLHFLAMTLKGTSNDFSQMLKYVRAAYMCQSKCIESPFGTVFQQIVCATTAVIVSVHTFLNLSPS